ncbi:MAG: AMP-dependent synthetase [Deltaproteobacteria bacterium GWA2_57_13]|nr:MAG: AMP-dependent synthetase [Deltaproteobacteria bacterium GWA2_57_13]OGQ50433.1 MAG: AMP-dependent synthetase [Deltaproteobacteria bacterium RIFCSPLOWO2_02_FULL_57_26]OGQ73844.1 MAG: AMP-dependent synthetase [Deltaproteobacteria bacterium RIFCSPLOWO2_12_FULL_57_22]
MERFDFGGEFVWQPTPEYVSKSRLKRFMDRHGIAGFAELLKRSTEDLEWFWSAVLKDLEIEFYKPYERVLDSSQGIAWTRWCVGGQMNIAHNCLDKRMGTPLEKRAALRWEGEEGTTRSLTYGELCRETNRLANALRGLGLRKGDVVGIFLPMVPETATAFFAVVKIGAIVLPLFSGYGAAAVATRLADASAKGLITADGFYRRGQKVAMKTIADEALSEVPSVEHVIVVNRLGVEAPWNEGRDHWWHELVQNKTADFETERTEAEDPLMIIYTSGTTGKPKGAVHTHCGFPVKAAQDMAHGLDLQESDTLYWVTDLGWMMGPWEVLGTTLLGATMVFYDGALDYPGPDRLWSLVRRQRVTALGVSPTLVRSLLRYGDEPVKKHDLASLRILGSTGEPWNRDPWLWLFKTVGGERLPIINYSGGTEISGGIVMGNVLTALKPCSFSGPLPGMAADVVNEKGEPVRNQVGELVVRKPWIGMTRGFWKDPERYLQTYWARFPDLWVHGDWAAIDQDGLWYILGRSDDTIKIAGKRLGPAEVESVLIAHPAVCEAAAIGIPDAVKGESLICFCVLNTGFAATEVLAEAIKELVAQNLGKPLKPSVVKFVKDLPKTRNAKVMRRVIRDAYLKQEMGDLSALENPSSVEEIRRAN